MTANSLTKITTLERQIMAVQTPEDANILRRQVAAVQKLIGDRHEAFRVAWEGGKAYCELSAKAGQEWEKIRPGEGGDRKSQKFFSVISASDAGFASSVDATMCVRIGEMHPEDLRTYYDVCTNDNKIPTLGGLYAVWKEMYGDFDPSRPWLRVYNILKPLNTASMSWKHTSNKETKHDHPLTASHVPPASHYPLGVGSCLHHCDRGGAGL
jgi:hypothetical protein